MKFLWAAIDNKNWQAESKYRTILLITGVLFALTGFLLWAAIRPFFLSSVDWMFCFIGYPIVISWFVIFFYSCRHDFHNGKHNS